MGKKSRHNGTEKTKGVQDISATGELDLLSMLDCLPFYVLLIDEKHHILMANKATKVALGLEPTDIIGHYCPKVIHGMNHPFPGCPLEKAVISGKVEETELYDERYGLWVRSAVYPTDKKTKEGYRIYIHVVRDITEQKRLEETLSKREEQLRHAQKMDALAQMASGIIHDFNNLTAAITGFSALAMKHVSEDKKLQEYLSSITTVSERASALTKQLLAFSREQTLEPRETNLNAVITNMKTMLKYLVGKTHELILELQPDLWMVEADPPQIERAILNLVVNARDAMPVEGKLTITTENIIVDNKLCGTIPDARPGNFIRLSVSDTGTGMDEETIRQIFDPFFSTKGEKGTGLGLSTVYGIVKQHNGWITVDSKLGHGARFHIYLEAITDKK